MRSIAIVMSLAAVCAVRCAVAQTVNGPTVKASQTGVGPVMRSEGPDAATRAKLRAGMYARMGGPVNRPDKEPGICFLNAQRTVGTAAIETAMTNIRNEFRVSCYLKDWKFEGLPALARYAAATNNACVVCVVDDPGFPQMLVAPDDAWALVNVAPLKADRPAADRLAERLAKIAYRGFGIAMGSGFSAQAGGLLQRADTLAELDAIYGRASPPDCHFPILECCEKRGVARGGTASYRIACIEGWAPPPKDDVQRKIAEEVKALGK